MKTMKDFQIWDRSIVEKQTRIYKGSKSNYIYMSGKPVLLSSCKKSWVEDDSIE